MAAPDIFLSYNREDAARAKHFADGFAAQGLDVWWDVALRSGEAYDEVTEQALRNAKAVVVLWSPRSAISRWVRAEATLADRNKTLMPAMIEPCERPIMFELTQTAELSHWDGEADDPVWRAFAAQVREFVGKGGAAAPAADRAPVRRPLPSKPSIAVLPFLNLSGDPEQEYFADGVVDDIISGLTRFNQLFVIARSSSFTFKGRQVDCRAVADELGVRFILEGSIRKAGNRLRISGQLVDAQTGAHLWADRFDGALEDVFELQDHITEQVVGAIEPSIKQAEIVRARSKPPESLDAYELYLQALPLLWAFTSEANRPARQLLEQALVIDPDYPQALAMAAWAYEQGRWMGLSEEQVSGDLAKALEYARRGLATGSNDADVLALCGFIVLMVGHDQPTAIAAKDRAMLRNPNSPWAAQFSSMISTFTGDAEAGVELAERAIRQNPLDPRKFNFMQALALALAGLGRWEEAAAASEMCLADAPNWAPALSLAVAVAVQNGDLDKAKKLTRRLLTGDPGITIARHVDPFRGRAPTLEAAYRTGLGAMGIPA